MDGMDNDDDDGDDTSRMKMKKAGQVSRGS
jgi:hypothetical protein